MQEREGGDISYRDMVEGRQMSSPCKEFFHGSTVFVTGATGFMGKVLIEKLLRTCTGIKKLFILARPKKGKEITERFKEQFADPLYDRLKAEVPDFMAKLHIVAGDVGLLNLGLSDADYAAITKEVNVMFHLAATVRFDERLQHAVFVNIRGTREMVLLARKSTSLKALVHVSTAYSNCIETEISEKFYDPPMKSDKLLQLAETLDEEMLHKMTPILLDKFPNTYAYTKVISENAVKELSHGLPVTIVRPAIIIATAKEPVAGWIDNVYGPTGVVVGAAVGLLRTLYCDPNNIADIVPVDFVVNATILAAYETGKNHDTPNKESPTSRENGWEDYGRAEEKEITIYNYISSTQRPISWERFMSLTEKHGLAVPTMMAIWHYMFTLNKHWPVHVLYMLFLHMIPAYLVDTAAYLVGKKPMLVKAYEKIHKFSSVIEYFSIRSWKFHNNNTQALCTREQELFPCDISKLDWETYFYTYVRGLRVYLVKDPLDTLPQAKKRKIILQLSHYAVMAVIWFSLFRLLWFFLGALNLV